MRMAGRSARTFTYLGSVGPPWSGRLPWIVLAVIILAGAIVRVHDLGSNSLWLDEAAIWQISLGSLKDVADQNARINSAPPLFPLLVKLVSQIAGNSEAVLRSIPLVSGVLGLVAVAALSRLWIGWAGTIAAVALAATAPVQVYYSRELREYSLGVLLTSLLLLTAHRVVMAPGKHAGAAWYTAIGALCITTQFGLWIVIAVTQCVYFVAVLHSRTRIAVRSFVASSACLGVLALWVYWVSLSGRVAAGSLSFSYLDYYYLTNRAPIALLHDIAQRSRTLLVYGTYGGPVAAVVSVVLIAFGVFALLRRDAYHRLALVYAFAPGALVVVLAMASVYPFGGVRQDLFLSPMIYVLFGAGLELVVQLRWMIGGRPLGVYGGAFLVVALPLLAVLWWRPHLADYWPSEGENLRPVLETMASRIEVGDEVYVFPLAGPAFHYYWDARGIGATAPRSGVKWEDLNIDPERDLEDVAALMKTSPRVWVVVSHTVDDQERQTIATLEARYMELDHVVPERGGLRYDNFVDPAAYLFTARSSEAD